MNNNDDGDGDGDDDDDDDDISNVQINICKYDQMHSTMVRKKIVRQKMIEMCVYA